MGPEAQSGGVLGGHGPQEAQAIWLLMDVVSNITINQWWLKPGSSWLKGYVAGCAQTILAQA